MPASIGHAAFLKIPLRSLSLLVTGGILVLQLTACSPSSNQETEKKVVENQPVVDSRMEEQPTASYTADQILNGETPGRKASPPMIETDDDTGFAKERLYHVPAPGIHPRILFGPEDLPRIRAQLEGTENGRILLDQLKTKIARGIDKPGTPENEALQAMMKGDPTKADAIQADFKAHPAPGSITNPLFAALTEKAFYCLVMNDRAEGVKTAAAAAAFAQYLEPQIEAAAQAPGADDFWKSIRSVCGSGPSLGLIYDFSQPFMTREQADIYRRVLTKATKGHYVLGMDLPHHWRNWNFIGMAEEFPLMSLALEGEDGFDPRIYARGSEVAHDYVNYSLSDQGIAKEAIGYHTAGFGHLSLLMLAMANRGDNLLINEKYRKMFENWFIWAQQPFGGLGPAAETSARFRPATPRCKRPNFSTRRIPRSILFFKITPPTEN